MGSPLLQHALSALQDCFLALVEAVLFFSPAGAAALHNAAISGQHCCGFGHAAISAQQSWVQLDFKDADANGNFRQKHYHENYGYDIDAVISKHPIKELDNSSHKEDLLNSLKKGNRQSATFLKDGQEVKQYIEASPQFKTLTIYDANHKRLDTRQAKEQEQSQAQGKDQKHEAKKTQTAADDDGPGEQQEKKQRRKKQSF